MFVDKLDNLNKKKKEKIKIKYMRLGVFFIIYYSKSSLILLKSIGCPGLNAGNPK